MTNATAMSLAGKRVVVVGGATGIGFAIAKLACEQGAAVVIASSNKVNVNAAVERLRGAKGHSVDLRDVASVSGFFKEVGAFDHLAITSGDWGGPMLVSVQDLDLTQAQGLFTVRFWGALAAVKHCCHTIAQEARSLSRAAWLGTAP